MEENEQQGAEQPAQQEPVVVPSNAPYGFLRETLGDELYAQFIAKMDGSNMKLANVAGGAYIAKGEHDAALGRLQTRVTELTGQLAAREKEIADERKKGMAMDALRKSGARNAELLLRSIDMDKVTLNDGKLTGMDEQVKALMQSDPYLFEGAPGERGGLPSASGAPEGDGPASDPINRTMNSAIRAAAGYR